MAASLKTINNYQLTPRDLGSGLASLLEAARVVMADASYSPEYSVIFVALDKEREERAGSRAFVTEYLLPHVVNRFKCTVQVTQPGVSMRSYSGSYQPGYHVQLLRTTAEPTAS